MSIFCQLEANWVIILIDRDISDRKLERIQVFCKQQHRINNPNLALILINLLNSIPAVCLRNRSVSVESGIRTALFLAHSDLCKLNSFIKN